MAEHKTYQTVVNDVLGDPRISQGNLFGMPMLKINGKPLTFVNRKYGPKA